MFLARLLKSFLKKYLFNLPLAFLDSFRKNFKLLRGANVTSVFESHKLFWTFLKINLIFRSVLFVSISRNVCFQCGCKSSMFIQLYKNFLNVFLKYFLRHWNRANWKEKFFLCSTLLKRNMKKTETCLGLIAITYWILSLGIE